jgi:putative copper resistance protein D
MSLLYSSMIIFYWLFLSGVIFLAGAFVSRVYVTGPSGAEACFPDGTKKSLGKTAVQYILLISVLTLLANAVHFVLHCSIMTETSLKEVFSILPAFITKTKYGRFTILRTAFLAGIIVVSFVAVRKDQKWTNLVGGLFSFLLLVVIAMSGHQGAKGYLNFPFFLDVLHLIAVSLWIGGLFFIRPFVSALVKGACVETWGNLTSLINRFSQVATFCVFIAAITGISLAYFNIKSMTILTQTNYGNVLLIKLLLVGIIMIIGALNKFLVIPNLNNVDPEKKPEDMKHGWKLFYSVNIEASIGFVVLLLTSFLTHLSPIG